MRLIFDINWFLLEVLEIGVPTESYVKPLVSVCVFMSSQRYIWRKQFSLFLESFRSLFPLFRRRHRLSDSLKLLRFDPAVILFTLLQMP